MCFQSIVLNPVNPLNIPEVWQIMFLTPFQRPENRDGGQRFCLSELVYLDSNVQSQMEAIRENYYGFFCQICLDSLSSEFQFESFDLSSLLSANDVIQEVEWGRHTRGS